MCAATEFEFTGGALSGLSTTLVVDILLASAANAINQADRNIMPIAVIPMAEEFQWSLMQCSLVLSSFAYGYILTQLPGGMIATHLPPLRLLLTAVSGWSLMTLLIPGAAFRGIEVVFACRVVMGVAEGFCLPAIFQLFATRVPESFRSRAFAIMLGCGSVGQLAALLICPQIDAWPVMFYSFGGAGLVWAVLCLLRLCAAQRIGTTLAARDHALPPEVEGPRTRGVSRGSGHEGSRAGAAEGMAEGLQREEGTVLLPRQLLVPRLLRCWPLYAICAAHFAQNWTNYTLSSWLPTYLHDMLGMETKQLSLTALPFAINAVAGVGFAMSADRVESRRGVLLPLLSVRRTATLVGLLGPAACHLFLIAADSAPLAIVAVTLSFFLGAATCSGYMANHADLSASYAGLTFAIANTVATIPGLLAPPVTAWMVGEQPTRGSWAAVFALAALVNVAGSVAYLALADARRVL